MRAIVLALAWAATLVGAFVLGRSEGSEAEEGGAASAEVERLRAQVLALEAERARSPAPSLQPTERGAAMGEARTVHVAADGATSPSAGTPEEAPATIDLAGVSNPDEAVRRLLAFAEAKLAQGTKGHLELLRAMDALFKGPDAKRLFDDDSGPRVVYPLLKFAVSREGQMVAFTETVFRTMAEDPGSLDVVDKDTLEVFTEGFAVALPGAVDEPTLERFRGYARKVLATPDEKSASPVQANKPRLKRALGYWAPPLSSTEAVERLRRGEASGDETLALLKRVTPEDMKALDVAALVGPLVESGDMRVLYGLRSLHLDASSVAALDARVVSGAASGKIQPWAISNYLNATGRSTWADARPFFERGLSRGEKATDAFGQALAQLGGPLAPPPDYVQGVLSSYTFSDGVRSSLSRRLPK